MSDVTTELLVRQARMKVAVADPARRVAPAIAALAAGAGAELVARQHLSREILAKRLEKRR